MNRKILFIAPFCAAALMLSSCGGGLSQEPYETYEALDYLAIQKDKDGEWSFCGKDGEVQQTTTYANRPSAVFNGYFTVNESKNEYKYALYKYGEKPELVKGADGLVSVGAMNEGLCPVVRKGERISVIDKDGETVFTLDPIKNVEIVACNPMYTYGYLLVNNAEGKQGFVDKKGEVVIEVKYDGFCGMEDGLFLMKNDKKWQLLNKEGEEVVALRDKYTPLEFHSGLIKAMDDNGNFYFLDKNGEEVVKCPAAVKGVGEFTKDYYVFRGDSDYGVMDMEGNKVLRDLYSSVEFVKADEWLVRNSKDKYEILNKKEESVREFGDNAAVQFLGKFGYNTTNNGNSEFVAEDGKAVQKSDFNNINDNPTQGSVRSDFKKADGGNGGYEEVAEQAVMQAFAY